MNPSSAAPARRRLLLLGCLVALLVPLLPAGAASASGIVKFSKIHYGQTGTNLNTEYVILKNYGDATVRLRGWEIVSAPSSDNQHYFFPRTRIAPGHSLVLYTGSGTNGPGKRYWRSTTFRWDNSGDKAILLTPSAAIADSCQYAGGGTTAYC